MIDKGAKRRIILGMGKPNQAKKSSVFVFDRYALDRDAKSASFFYRLDLKDGRPALVFEEKIILPKQKIIWSKVNQPLLARALFNLHLALGVSYYKTYCPPVIKIKSGQLSAADAAFWNKLYTKGMGEFFYKNKIDFRGLVNFPVALKKPAAPIKAKLSDKTLLPWGGGKDSIVAGEKLKALGHDFTLVALRAEEAQIDTAKIIGKKLLIFERILDPQLKLINAAGAYNGHIPISSIYAFTTVLAAVLYDFKNIAYTNEASANIGNVNYLGETINHQYSKSLEFENDLRLYLKNSITPDIHYFSTMRAYSELKIVSEFARYPQYFSSFVSCNRHYVLNKVVKMRWCGRCPKCAFVFSQLAAFLPKATVIKIFNKNLFADAALLPLYQELWGEKSFKPFECVGEAKEVAAAMLLAAKRSNWRTDAIMTYFLKNRATKIKDQAALIASSLKRSPEHNIPINFQRILILGYGYEGRSFARYLSRLYPALKFTIADEKEINNAPRQATTVSGPNYLETVYDADLIIKSPGVNDQKPELVAAKTLGQKITTVTNIFLAQAADRTIGVTGTKGKSTTASLIRAMLKAGGIKAELVGNIGADPLKFIDDKKAVFVYELSSYQLSSAETSPHVAVFINIFPDHLPYHGSFAAYFYAKAKIANRQKVGDYFIYNSDHKIIKGLAAATPATKINYLQQGAVKNNWLYYHGEKIVPLSEIRLLGKHNQENILAAMAAAKIYGVKNAAIRQALKQFTNLKHRLEFVGRYREIDFYDDAISTTPESTLAAIAVFEQRLGTIILGGSDRGYDFSALAKKLVSLKLDGLVFFPASGPRIAAALKQAAKANKTKLPPSMLATTMNEAVKFCREQTGPGRVCLLSTASPSYSLFKNFEDKGDQFQTAVKKIGK